MPIIGAWKYVENSNILHLKTAELYLLVPLSIESCVVMDRVIKIWISGNGITALLHRPLNPFYFKNISHFEFAKAEIIFEGKDSIPIYKYK